LELPRRDVAHYISKEVANMDMFTLLSDETDISILSWRLKEGYTAKCNLYHLSEKLRKRGWQIPAYPLRKSMEDVTIMRIVVSNGLSMVMAHLLVDNIKRSVEYLGNLEWKMPKEKAQHTFSSLNFHMKRRGLILYYQIHRAKI